MKMWMYALFVFIGGCSLGALSTSVKLAYGAGFNLAQITISQFMIGAALLWILVLFTRKSKMSIKYLGLLLLCGIPMSLTGVFYYFSLQTIDASLAIIFLFQFVWIGSLFDYILYRKTPSKAQWLSIVILLIGSLLATAIITNGFGSFTINGVIFGILSAFTFTSFLFISGNVGKELPPLQKSALIATGGLIFVSILFPPTTAFESVSQMISFSPYGVFLGVFGVCLPPLLFAIGMPKVGTGLGTILSASELPVAVILSAVVLVEYVAPIQWLGVIVVLLGVALGNIKLSSFSKNKNWQAKKVS
ncbi:EamA family transporter [Salipaludibacillus neizhouensis]|uniref:EamA family transporter n=1 Tax=Salipaludibacillus neizhouensis TaxID=885475 RepID=A0A3A9KA99_9BACI|nr:DMT family transporter [Salipaludibacillus neizhouensis]RKL67472.1 EamA family transporter [Salipaludibacillus neizhouensis]